MRDLQLKSPDNVSANRRSKSTPEVNGSLRKVINKSLNPALEGASDEKSTVLEPLEEISEISNDNNLGESTEITRECFNPALETASEEDSAVLGPLSELLEVSDDILSGEITESFIAMVNPADKHLTETDGFSDLTSPLLSSFSVIISEKHVILDGEDPKCNGPEDSKDSFNIIETLELEMVMKHLKEARIRVLKSSDLGHSKKLLVLVITTIMEEFTGNQHEEKTWLAKLLSGKVLVPLTFMMVMFVMLVLWLFSSEIYGSYQGPPPT